ncbi:MAG: FAD:protein FMN transferase [Kiritimatiellaeota bacterium]|nr:FAD:protein FMN transferase [Kiritimatiellota bacterium]
MGAIGKGFALDRMAEELAEWEPSPWLLVAGGSSLLAGAPPPAAPGWEARLEESGALRRCWLAHGALGGSGVSTKGLHILDPRSGAPARRRARAWARARSAAEADALSTAAMVLSEAELAEIMAARTDAQVILCDAGRWRAYGHPPPGSVAQDEI